VKKVIAILVQIVLVAQVVLLLVSWLIAAAMPQSAVRSLLSSEGIRWLFGSLTGNLATPTLLCLILILMAVGAMRKSGIRHLFVRATYRQRFAQRVVIAELVLLFIVLLLLTAVPEASLLSVTGVLFPSSFTDSLLPVFCIVVIAVCLSYGFVSGRLSTCEDALDAMSSGLSRWRGLVVLYLVLAEFFESLRYVFTAW
jgi:aminobenzoyl-glutamate transport protein